MPLEAALESTNLEMTKRLKYTKDILTHMLSSSVKSGSVASQRTQRVAQTAALAQAVPPMSAATDFRKGARLC